MPDEEFITEFLRESNAIENVYDDDALDDARAAWEYIREQEELTHDSIKTVHQRLLENRQPDIAGEYRNVRVRVGSDFPPRPVKVPPLMTELLDTPVRTAVEAIDWHVSFEKIHPFADGNGRVGRILYLWHCVEHLDTPPVMWREDDVAGYYALFETADTPTLPE